jgi:hypothetical protein
MAMSTRTTFLITIAAATLLISFSPLMSPLVQAQNNLTEENMTMEESTNASLIQYPDMMENVTVMEEETKALVGNATGNMTSQNMTSGNMTG